MHRIDVCGEVCPVGHRADRREQTTHEQHDHHKEPHQQDGLLHGFIIIGDDKAETAEDECQQHGKQIDKAEIARRGYAVDSPGEYEAYRHDDNGDDPIGYDFCEDERPLVHRCHVDSLDGATLLFAHDVERGQKSTHQHDEYRHERWYHEHFVVEVFIV